MPFMARMMAQSDGPSEVSAGSSIPSAYPSGMLIGVE
jgi:hypothetical protein